MKTLQGRRDATSSSGKKKTQNVIQYSGLGLEMGIAVALGIITGKYLDSRFETTPIFFWCGLGLGLGAAAKALFDIAAKVKKDLSDNEP